MCVQQLENLEIVEDAVVEEGPVLPLPGVRVAFKPAGHELGRKLGVRPPSPKVYSSRQPRQDLTALQVDVVASSSTGASRRGKYLFSVFLSSFHFFFFQALGFPCFINNFF